MNLSLHHSISVALSGGGARGAIHIGVLAYLDEKGIRPKMISGTSIGALIGSLYASGLSSDEILDLMKSKSIRQLVQTNFKKRVSFLNLNGLKNILEQYLPKDFSEFKIPFICCATDLDLKDAVYFDSGAEVADKVIASCSIPMVFEPKIIDGDSFVDGGLMNNLPVQVLPKHHFKIGVHVNNYPLKPIHVMNDVATRVINIAVGKTAMEGKQVSDLLIEPVLSRDYGTLDLKSTQELYDIGYREAKKMLK